MRHHNGGAYRCCNESRIQRNVVKAAAGQIELTARIIIVEIDDQRLDRKYLLPDLAVMDLIRFRESYRKSQAAGRGTAFTVSGPKTAQGSFDFLHGVAQSLNHRLDRSGFQFFVKCQSDSLLHAIGDDISLKDLHKAPPSLVTRIIRILL
jgi:hypothetical protein